MKTKFLYTLLMALIVSVAAFADPIEEGKLLFNSRCAACHNVNKRLTGPALAGVEDRHSMEWIIHFVQSSQSMVRNGDKEAIALFEQFNKIPMPDHSDLTADHIKGILEFIKAETVASDNTAPFVKPGKQVTPYLPLSLTTDAGLFAGYIFVVFLLVMTLLFAVRLQKLRSKNAADRTLG
jgi:cytochrome c551/c552